MADERPPNLVQLTTEYLVTGPSGKLSIGIGDALWHLSTERIIQILLTHLNASKFNGN
ncbi:hypothetical protein [Lactiplantibacillus pentosus]|jgi:hypothetical protein|uniref:hypothetical protein n=1 Tax=Lactiplantibacillus pentosus TaxID=1589 RepID=UPI0020794BF2|nr:hypothetical protein [Lactiplantibacillus pentosus]USJ87916.1 hypothetical protein KSF55_03840 [Lactiplantibacillus pentosus]